MGDGQHAAYLQMCRRVSSNSTEQRFWAIAAVGIAKTFAASQSGLELLPFFSSAAIGLWQVFAIWRLDPAQARDSLRSDATI